MEEGAVGVVVDVVVPGFVFGWLEEFDFDGHFFHFNGTRMTQINTDFFLSLAEPAEYKEQGPEVRDQRSGVRKIRQKGKSTYPFGIEMFEGFRNF